MKSINKKEVIHCWATAPSIKNLCLDLWRLMQFLFCLVGHQCLASDLEECPYLVANIKRRSVLHLVKCDLSFDCKY